LSEHTHTHTHCINGHFPGKPGLASCPLDSLSLVILNLSIPSRDGVSKTLHYQQSTLECTPPFTLSTPSSDCPKLFDTPRLCNDSIHVMAH